MSTLTLETARALVAATRTHAWEAGLRPLAVVVLDTGGHLVAAEREDGSSTKRFEIAYGKAHGAIALGRGSRSIAEQADDAPAFVVAVASVIGGALIPAPGGVLIRDADGALLGAVGASGDSSDRDEAAVVAGIESVGLVAQID